MSEFTIRAMTPDDAEGIEAVNDQIQGADRSEAWQTYVDRFLASSSLHSAGTEFAGSQVAEVDGEIVGFALSIRQRGNEQPAGGARLIAVAVRPDQRRQGLGKQLVEAVCEVMKSRNVESVYSVLRDNDEEHAKFLAACGFKEESRRPPSGHTRLYSLDVNSDN